MKNLALDTSIVPTVYRLRAIDADGDVVADTVVTRLPSEIDEAVRVARKAFAEAGFGDVSIDCWPA